MNTTDTVATIERLEDERYAAMLAKDVAVLQRLLHPDLVYMHSSGVADSKASYIEGLGNGAWDYRRIDRSDQTIRVHDGVAFVFNRLRIGIVMNADRAAVRCHSGERLSMAGAMRPFSFEAAPVRVVFGSGTMAQLPAEAGRLGLERLLVLSTPGHREQAERVSDLLGERAAATFASARMHTPVAVTEAATALARERRIDGLVAIGGGSAIGLGKAVALRTDLPQIVLPTTYAGSEMTALLGETRDGVKATQTSPKVRPELVIYDVDLTLSLPPAISATSGLNAIAHAVEAMYAEDRNPVVSLMAEEGVRALFGALPAIVADPGAVEARSMALYGAWLCRAMPTEPRHAPHARGAGGERAGGARDRPSRSRSSPDRPANSLQRAALAAGDRHAGRRHRACGRPRDRKALSEPPPGGPDRRPGGAGSRLCGRAITGRRLNHG